MDILSNIVIGQFVPADSLIHRLDARMKVFLAAFFIVNIFLLKSLAPLVCLLFFFTLCTFFSKISVVYIFRGLRLLLYFFIFAFFIHIFFTAEGTPIFSIGSVVITDTGVKNGTVIVLRLFLLVFSTTLLTLTTTPVALTEAIESLGKPLKKMGFPVHEFAMMTTIALRFIPTLFEEVNKIIKAQVSRGAQLDTGPFMERAKNFLSILIPLFANAFKRADELAVAMEVRCYRGDVGRTRMYRTHISLRDWMALLCCMIMASLTLVLQYGSII